MNRSFDHENLDVYKVSIQFVAWTGELIDGVLSRQRQSAVKHLDNASTSIPLNIAEGNGKRSPQDRCRFFDIERFSSGVFCMFRCTGGTKSHQREAS